jgi:hypothetical protein
MPDPVHLQVDWIGYVVADQFKARMADPLADVGLATGEIVVEADHLFASFHQPVYQVRAHKTGAAGDQVAGQRGRHQWDVRVWCQAQAWLRIVLSSG